MKILTFNHHESFLVSLSHLPYEFDVVIKKGDLDLSWSPTARTVPPNFRLITFEEATKGLTSGAYCFVVAHTVKNLVWLLPYKTARCVFVAHIPLFYSSSLLRIKSALKLAFVKFFRVFRGLEFVAVSRMKLASWSVPGKAIPFFPVPLSRVSSPNGSDNRTDFDSSVSGSLKIGVVGNNFQNRREELGFDLLEQISEKIPLRIIGKNPTISGAICPKLFEEFASEFRALDVYIYTIRDDSGDGYNTSLLEAMLHEKAIVTVPNESSPITDGVNGLVARSLQDFLDALEKLRSDPDLRLRLGRAARETVERNFNSQNFVRDWLSVFEKFQSHSQVKVIS